MRIPATINKNTIKAYHRVNKSNNEESTLKSYSFSDWDKNIPNNLRELCVETLAKNWIENPVLDEIVLAGDRCLLLTILPDDLPLELTVPKIQDEFYWKRQYQEKWPNAPPSLLPEMDTSGGIWSSSKKSSICSQELNRPDDILCTAKRKWKEYFLERHVKLFFEKLKPEEYDAEKVKELVDLCKLYVKVLILDELQCATSSPNHIPLNAIISGFQNLTELSICFKQIHAKNNFRWDILNISDQDIKLFAKGLEKCRLNIFRIKNSDIDDDKLIIILKVLRKHENLETLDFSHCKISNNGLIGLSQFCLENPVKTLILSNNKIGPKGAEALAYVICKYSCNLMHIDLRLNQIGEEGCDFLIKALSVGSKKLKFLSLSACQLTKNNIGLGSMLENNSTLEILEIANNKIGKDLGEKILAGLRYNMTIRKLDVRMCRISPITEQKILYKISCNRKVLQRLNLIRKPLILEPDIDFAIDEKLKFEIKNILN